MFIDGAGEINEVATVRSFIQPLFINGFCLNQKKLLSIAKNLYYNMKSLLLFLMFLPVTYATVTVSQGFSLRVTGTGQ